MKKIIIAAAAALCFASSSFAQENAGGDSASSSAFGDMNKETIVAGVVAVGVLGAMVANNRGNAKVDDIVVIIDPTCSGSDPLVDGVCTGTTTTVTVTGTGTGTTTLTVPVTFTYLPTV
jgi:hypothetical protein